MMVARYAMLGLALALAATSAQAQVPDENNASMATGTRFKKAPESPDAAKGRWMQKRVANCVSNRSKDEVRKLLANSNFYSIDFEQAGFEAETMFDDLGVSYCIGRLMRGADNRVYQMYMQIQYSTLRNLLAEEVYLQDFDSPPAIVPGSAPDVAGRFDGRRVHPQISTMAALADCLTFNAPQASHDLLEARPGSGKEEGAIEVLGPIVASCANTSESEMTVATSLIRQMAADGLWSRGHYTTAEEAN